MATSSVILDIRANTQRALSEFKTFSSQLDNKFLISGLKLDVVRNALSQINREFQRSMGEQGLASAQSLKAAENQAAQLTNIYTGFSKAASARITEDFSKALSDVAVKTGGTVSDIQKSLATAPFLSRTLNTQQRGAILSDIQRVQTFASQAGLGNNAADVFRKIATGQTNFMELEGSDDTLSRVIGARLRQAAPVSDLGSLSIETRTEVLKKVIQNLDVNELEELAKETGGFRVVLAKFSASLFNPKAGLFGAMREFTLRTGEAPTTLFKETTKLFESIFGENGFIKTLGKELAKAFGIRGEDAAVKFLGRGIRFITNLIKNVTDLIDDVLNNPLVKSIIGVVKSAFDGIVGFIQKLDDIAKNPPEMPDISPESIKRFIRDIGESIRGFLRKVGATIRGEDISDEAQSGASIVGTIVDEAGKTMLTFFKEVGDALLAKAGTIAIELAKVLPGTIAGIIGAGLSGQGGLSGFLLSALGAGGLGLGALNLTRGGTQLVGQGVRQYRRAGIRGSAMEYFFGHGGFGGGGRGRGGGVGPNIPPGLDDLLSSIRDEEELTQKNRGLGDRIRDQYTRVTAPRSQWPRPGTDLELLQRRKAISEGRITASTSVLAGTINELISPEDILKRSIVSGGKITPKTTMFKPQVYSSQYLTPAGPLPHGSVEPWTMVDGEYRPFMGEVNPEFIEEERIRKRAFIEEERKQELIRRRALGNRNPFTSFGRDLIDTSGIDAVPGYIDRGRQSAAARFNRRYGFGGTRAVMGRGIGRFGARIGGMGRGIGSYYRGGGGSGVTGLLGAGIGLGGTMLGESIGGETGENISALSQIGGGALSGASMGAMIGSIIPGVGTAVGATIGAIIGGAAPLMDKGVRDAVGRFIGDIGKSLSDGAKGLADSISGGISFLQSGWNSAIKTAQDWVMGLLPKKIQETISYFTEELPKKIKGFAVGLGISMLDSVKNFNLGQAVLNAWEDIKKNFPRRAIGGTVERGVPYKVGEMGEELFIPSQSGSIVNNATLNGLASRSTSGGSSSVTFNVTINATGLAGNDIAAAIQPAVIKILDDGMKQASSNMVTRGATVI